MGGGRGGGTASTAQPKLNGINVQSSVYGAAIARGWGTFRVPANLLWYGDFQAIAHTSKTKTGGKGGGGGSNNATSYTYKAALVLGVCRGPIVAIRTVYRDKDVFVGSGALSNAGLSLKTGAIGQSVWGHLSTNHPAEAVGYSGIAYVYASAYDLRDGAILQNHSFEVQTSSRVSGKDDANPSTIVAEFLAQVPQWGAGLLDDLSGYGDYCLANGLLLSPVLTAQEKASAFLDKILAASNSEAVWSDGKLKIVPYGDTAATGNGVTWTPDLTPLYDLTVADFLPETEGEDALRYDLKRPADAYNRVQVEYLDRANAYNVAMQPGVDQASIDGSGERKADPIRLDCICDTAVAVTIAQLRVQRSSGMRTTYKFRLPWNYVLLDPMDLVTVTDLEQGIDRVLVQLTEIVEGEDGDFDCEAEEMLVGSAAPAAITRQPMDGYRPNYAAAPGDSVAPVIINVPRTLTDGAYEVWIGTAGGADWGGAEVWASVDGSTYELQGRIDGAARFGVTTAATPLVSGLDTTTDLKVNLTQSLGTLSPATQAEVDAYSTLCLLGTELVAYRDATLTAANRYTLEYLRRGLLGTKAAAWPTGTRFTRLDGALFSFPYRKDQIGLEVSVKLRSFNVYGQSLQDLADVDAYDFTLSPVPGYLIVTLDEVEDDDGNPLDPDLIKNDQVAFVERVRLTTFRDEVMAAFTPSNVEFSFTPNKGRLIVTPVEGGGSPFFQITGLNERGCDIHVIRMNLMGTAGWLPSDWRGIIYYSTAGKIADGSGAHSFGGAYQKVVGYPVRGVRTDRHRFLEFDMSVLTSGGTDYVDSIITGLRFYLTKTPGGTAGLDIGQILLGFSAEADSVSLPFDDFFDKPVGVNENWTGDVVLTKDQNATGGANPGEIRIQGGSIYATGGKRDVLAQTWLGTPYETATGAIGYFYLICGLELLSTRFPTYDTGTVDGRIFTAVYNPELRRWWAIDNAKLFIPFVPLASDVIIAKGARRPADAGIGVLKPTGAENTNPPLDGAGTVILGRETTDSPPSFYVSAMPYGGVMREAKNAASLGITAFTGVGILTTENNGTTFVGMIQTFRRGQRVIQRTSSTAANWGSFVEPFNPNLLPKWTTDIGLRPTELTDGRITRGLDSLGFLRTSLKAGTTLTLQNGNEVSFGGQSYEMDYEDGVPLTFPVAYPTAPILTPLPTNLKTPDASTKYLEVKPTAKSGTGATLSAKVVTPGTGSTTTARTDSGAGGLVGAAPAASLERQKALAGVDKDGQYIATVTVRVRGDADPEGGPTVYPVPITVVFQGRRTAGAAWTTLGSTQTIGNQNPTTGGTRTITITGEPPNWTTWATHADTEYRVIITAGYLAGSRELTAFTSVTYTEATGGTADTSVTAIQSGKKGRVQVTPVDQ